MAGIQHLGAPLRKLRQPGVRAHVLAVLFVAVFLLGFQNRAIFLPLDPAQKISLNISDHKPAEDLLTPLAEPVKEYIVEDTSGKKEKADISSNSSPGKGKKEILDDKIFPPANEKEMPSSSERKAEISSNYSPNQEIAKISTNGTLILEK